MLLEGRVAIITGASRGIGKAIAVLFAENGADLVINGSRKETIAAVSKEIQEATGRKCLFVADDISNPETAEKLVDTALENFGKVDILVNNAGTITRSSMEDMTMEEWDRVLSVNLNSALHTCRAVLPHMRENKYGKIVNISSGAGKKPHSNAAPSYAVSKAGLLALTKHIAMEQAKNKIWANAICPGPIRSEMSDQWSEEYRQKVISTIPLGHMGRPEDVAGAALFLASELSNFVTGESVNVNGGTLMD